MIVNDDRCVRCGDYCGEGHIFCKPCLNELEKKYGRGWSTGDSPVTRNVLSGVDWDFLCAECGIRLSKPLRVEMDKSGEEDVDLYEYRYCPNCGRRIV